MEKRKVKVRVKSKKELLYITGSDKLSSHSEKILVGDIDNLGQFRIGVLTLPPDTFVVLDEVPLETQVGGDHYKYMQIQPIEFIHKNNLSFIQGNIIKYTCRYKAKNGKEDLLKARHYLDLLIKLEYEK